MASWRSPRLRVLRLWLCARRARNRPRRPSHLRSTPRYELTVGGFVLQAVGVMNVVALHTGAHAGGNAI